jgi:hypothetical protein
LLAGSARATCELWSYEFGWELRLDVNRVMLRTQVTRTATDIDATAEQWRAAMVVKGWHEVH